MSKRRNVSRPRTNHGKWKDAVQAERHKRALELKTQRDKLTPEQQLAKLDQLGFRAIKERTRLEGQIKNKQSKSKG